VIRRAATAILLALGLSLAPPAATPAAAASAAPADDIYVLVNQARWANGQAGLIRNAAMDQVAANWAAAMAASGTMSHNPDYAAQIPGGWTAAGENVAQGHPTGAAMHSGWMGSSGHRANILGDFTDIGIAFLSSGGTTWGVEVFARYPGHAGPAAPAPPPAPPPAPAPPGDPAVPRDPAPGETPAATPVATPTPADSATPSSTPSPSTPPIRAEADAATGPEGAELGFEVWGLVVAIMAIAAAALSTITRRRTPGAADATLRARDDGVAQ
jgi:hypothetical protein